MQKAIACAATMAFAVAQCGCGGGGGMRACCGMGSCTPQCAIIDRPTKGGGGKSQDVIPKDLALLKCTKTSTVMQTQLVKRTRHIMLPKLKKVRKIVIERRLKTPTKFRQVTVQVKTMVPTLDQRNEVVMDIDAIVDVPRKQSDVTEMIDQTRTVTVTEMQSVRSMELETVIENQIVPEKRWSLFERQAKFKPEGYAELDQLSDIEQPTDEQMQGENAIPQTEPAVEPEQPEDPTDEPMVKPEQPEDPTVVVPVVIPPVLPPAPTVIGPDWTQEENTEENAECENDCDAKCSSSWVPPCIKEARLNKDPSPFSVDSLVEIEQSWASPKFQDVAVTRLVPRDTIQPVTVTKEITVKVPQMIAGMSSTEEQDMNIPIDVFTPVGALVEISTPGVGYGDAIPVYEYNGNAMPTERFIDKVIQEPIYEYENVKVPVWVNVVETESTPEEYEVEIEVPSEVKVVDEACMWQLGW